MLSVLAPIIVSSPPTSHKVVSEDVYEILSNTLKFTQDQKFWWDTVGCVLAKMLRYSEYTVNSQFLHLFFFYMRVIPFMGPRPGEGNKPAFKSFMTDDCTPVEVSWVANSEGQFVVRYAVEPIDNALSGSAYNERDAAIRMIDAMRPSMNPSFNLEWFNVLDGALSWHEKTKRIKAKHDSQYFFGFDCGRSGDTTIKAYLTPEIRSAQTGIPKDDIVTHALATLNAGFEGVWGDILGYFATLPLSVRPEIESVATDCVVPEVSRLKIYVRTRSTRFSDLEGLMTLGGSLNGPVVNSGMEALVELWRDVIGIDTTAPDWKSQSLPTHHREHETITGGLLLYYELRSGFNVPFPKVYLPVHHYCSDDYTIANNIEKYFSQKGIKGMYKYTSTIQSIFGGHRALHTRSGIHTYLSLAIKRAGLEVTSYYNPEVYAPERTLL